MATLEDGSTGIQNSEHEDSNDYDALPPLRPPKPSPSEK